MINDTLARMWWPAGDALGQTIVAPGEASGGRTFEVIGIAKTGNYGAANEAPAAFVWFPYAQAYRPSMTVIAHVSGGDAEVVAGARQALKEIDPAVSLTNVTTFDALVRERSDNGIRAAALFIAALSLAGFLRAAFGMYGLLSYFAHVQVREIGIRMAFGASRAAIIRMAMRRGVTLAIRGVATGLVARGHRRSRAWPAAAECVRRAVGLGDRAAPARRRDTRRRLPADSPRAGRGATRGAPKRLTLGAGEPGRRAH